MCQLNTQTLGRAFLDPLNISGKFSDPQKPWENQPNQQTNSAPAAAAPAPRVDKEDLKQATSAGGDKPSSTVRRFNDLNIPTGAY
jgi:hypothetical protein